MNNIYDLVIIGGGAGGLFAGILAGNAGLNTLVVESESKLGKKMLATGNGRCNIANINFYDYCYNNPEYVKQIFNAFANKDKIQNYAKPILDIMQEYGLSFYSDSEGRVYPCSNCAASVVTVLTSALGRSGVEIMLSSTVQKITKEQENFEIEIGYDKAYAKNVLLCCGGSQTNLAEKLGHTITKFTRGLTGFKSQESFKRISGVRVSNVIVNAKFQNKLKTEYSDLVTIKDNTYSERGEVIFKDDGLSGICVMNLSCIVSRQKETPTMWLDLLPDISYEKILDKLEQGQYNYGILNVLYGWFSKLLADYLVYKFETPEEIANAIKHFKVTIRNTYDNNQITCGGVNVEELNLTASKLVDGLYLSGEMLNIDGICGGYNLMFAITSAGLSVKQILNKNKGIND